MFNSEEDVRAYYTRYAKQKGFGVSRRTSKLGDDGKSVKYFTLSCVCQGKAKSRAANPLKPQPKQNLGCKAKINASRCLDGRFMVSTVVLEHNHILSPGKARYFRCHKNMNPYVKRRLELLDKTGVRASKNYQSLVIEAGGFEKLPFGEKDARNHIDKARRLRLGVGGAEALRNYFARMQEKDDRKAEKENAQDHDSFKSMHPCITRYAIEKQFQEAYTNKKFKEVQDEFRNQMYCYSSLLKQEGAISTYQVDDEITIYDDMIKEVRFHVYFNEEECEVQCTCSLFEFKGILCRHALYVLTMMKKVKILPSKYIIPRWRKDLKRNYKYVKSSYDDLSGNPEAQRYDKLCASFSEVASMASKTEKSCMIVMTCIDKLKEKLHLNESSSENGQISHHTPGALTISNEVVNGTSMECNKVLSPAVVRSKGRPSSKRKESKVDNVVRKLKRKRQQSQKTSKKKKEKSIQVLVYIYFNYP
ncbi:protein FAR1-RELATED SEQUENCE 5-like [Fagus crenata]